MLFRTTVALLCMFIVDHAVVAASFDCTAATNAMDKTICADGPLNKADEEMGGYYFKLKDSLPKKRSQELLKEQRSWLQLRASKCAVEDSACLQQFYNERIHALRVRYENLVPYVFPDSTPLQGLRGTCGFVELQGTDNFAVYAAGAYSGRKLDVQIDQSGHQATQFDIVVNSPAKPVALILGAYEPSIWNIGWTSGTKILAVIATGYHRQAVAGLPRQTPILISTNDNQGPCGYISIRETDLAGVNPLSNRVYGKPVEMVHLAGGGKAIVGAPVAPGEPLFTSSDITPDDFVDKSKPLAGPAGLSDAVAKGLLRPATRQDLEMWADRKAKAMPKDSLPPVAGADSRMALMPQYVHNAFVILKPLQLPAGLYGGHSATFFLPEGVPYPQGNLGHSTLYDFNTMTCRGTACDIH